MEQPRDPNTGRFTTTPTEQLTHRERALLNRGKALRDEELEEERRSQLALDTRNELAETLVQASSLVPTEVIEPVLHSLKMRVDTQDGMRVINDLAGDEPTPLFTSPTLSEVSELQRAGAISALVERLDKLGERGQEASQLLKRHYFGSNSQVTF